MVLGSKGTRWFKSWPFHPLRSPGHQWKGSRFQLSIPSQKRSRSQNCQETIRFIPGTVLGGFEKFNSLENRLFQPLWKILATSPTIREWISFFRFQKNLKKKTSYHTTYTNSWHIVHWNECCKLCRDKIFQKPILTPTTQVTHVPIHPVPCHPWGSWGLSAGTHESEHESDESQISCGVSHLHLWFYRNSQRFGAGGVVGVGWSWFPPPQKKNKVPPPPPKKRSRILLGGCLPVTTFFWVCFSDFKSSKLLHPWRKTGITHFSSPVPSKHPNDKFPNSLIEFGSVTIQFHEKKS